MVKYIELMKACDHCELCYKSNGSGPGIDGHNKRLALHHLEGLKFEKRPDELTTIGIDEIYAECGKCKGNSDIIQKELLGYVSREQSEDYHRFPW